MMSDKRIEIVELSQEDLDAVAEIEKETFSLPWSRQSFADAIEDSFGLFLVARTLEEKQVLGYIGMYCTAEEGELTNVAVKSETRGQGIGGCLVDAMIREAQTRGIPRIVLEVRVSNAPAIATYENRGFINLGVRKNFYQLPREDAYIMVREEK